MSRLLPRALPLCAVTLLLATTIVAPAASASPGSGTHPTRTPPATTPSPEAVQGFVDTRVPELLEAHGAPGVAVTVVADGTQIASAAHGMADLAQSTPLEETTHSFPTASIAKSFTAMAVLQLVERGDIDLDEDITTYLPDDVRVADTHPGEPVTVHHLLTHTAGFAETLAWDDPDDPGSWRSAHEFLRETTADRIFPPGEFSAYSNYGTGLAGLIVEEVGGQPFEEYVHEHVFTPLGMEGTEFGQLDELAETHDLVTLHLPDGSVAVNDRIPLTAAGGAVTTTDDMARFMLALLDGGELNGERVLHPESVEMMLDRQYEYHPEGTALGYGTYEWRTGPPRGVGHGGDLNGLHTGYMMLPEIDTGMFVTVNGSDPEPGESIINDLRFAVLHAFADTFAPADPSHGELDTGADLSAYTGTYITTRRPTGGVEQLIPLFDNLTVRDAGDGSLRVSGAVVPEERWLPAGEGVFVTEDGTDELLFVGEGDRAAGVYLGLNPTSGYDRTTFLTNPTVLLVLVGVALLVLVSGMVRVRRPRGGPEIVA
ncbi:MAG TPA: beta-lactamase family protein, partial [Candidatus Nocardiopsis merdipullorum]|nr:beta-lactamase family protein [Candidatus Nocardiopsis merdipullorum]